MPFCRTCNAPIVFAKFEPDRYGRQANALPVDASPDPGGSIAFYELPSPNSNYPPEADAKVRTTFARRLSGYAAIDAYKRAGGSLYRVHFDTCGKVAQLSRSAGALEARGVRRY